MSAFTSWRISVLCETLAKRIIACLDVNAGRVVKGIQFEHLRDAGDPAELALAHSAAGADEIVLLDITATAESRNTLLDTVRRTARQLFIPLTVGGGIRSVDDAAAVLDCGADRVAMNSAALADPTLITRVAERYGSQAVVVAIDARESTPTAWEVYAWGGRQPTGRDAKEWAIAAEELGAGEIMLTSMDRDGTKAGFDCPLTRTIATSVPIPVIASGGAGEPQHFVEVFQEGAADAALAASVFHFGLKSVEAIKQALRDAGIPVRPAC
jgi:cyclase